MKNGFIITSLLISLAAGVVHAATYDYGSNITSNGQMVTAHTHATNDYCKVSLEAKYVIDGGYIKTIRDEAERDPSTGYATLTIKLPNDGKYFTSINSTHMIGKNKYISSTNNKSADIFLKHSDK